MVTEKYVMFGKDIDFWKNNHVIGLDIIASSKIHKFKDIFDDKRKSDFTSHQKFTSDMDNYMVILEKVNNIYKIIDQPLDTYDFLLFRPDKLKKTYVKYWTKTYTDIIQDIAIVYVYNDINLIHKLNPMYQTYKMAKILVKINRKYLEYLRSDLHIHDE